MNVSKNGGFSSRPPGHVIKQVELKIRNPEMVPGSW